MGVTAEIETAGTIEPPSEIFQFGSKVRFNVSPKLEHSGNSLQERYRPDVLRILDRNYGTVFKFVVQKLEDLDEVNQMVSDLSLHSPIYIMPEGVVATDWLAGRVYWQEVIEKTIRLGYRFTTRLHILFYGNKRAV